MQNSVTLVCVLFEKVGFFKENLTVVDIQYYND